MNEYIIGSGAILTAGPAAAATAATLHARADPATARCVGAALVDFEGGVSGELSRVVIVAAGWTPRRFNDEVVRPLARRDPTALAEVLVTLARATLADAIHIFARWLPDETLVATLHLAGIEVVSHPLESISQAALISGQSYTRWHGTLRAA